MKALIVILMSPLMLMFLLSALQTIEYCSTNHLQVPNAAYILLLVVAIWVYTSVKVSSEDTTEAKRKINAFFDNILNK